MKTIIVLAIIFATYYILKFLQAVSDKLVKKYSLLKTFNKMLPLIVSITWLIIIFWSTHFLFNTKSYYNLVVICIIVILSVLIGWFYVKDFIAGVIFRVQNNYTVGDNVQFGEISGNIETLSLTHISLNTKDDKTLRVPYSRLSNEVILQKTQIKTSEENSYILHTRKKNNVKSTEETIQNLLLTSPWRIANKQPNIKFTGEDDSYYSFKIQVQVRNQKHFDYLMEVLEKKLGL